MAGTATETLLITREFHAPIQQVFNAWTQAEVIAQWFGPEGFSVINAQIDLHVGGKYDLTIASPDKETVRHFGEYVEISPPYNLIFTWELEGQSCDGSEGQHASTLVTLVFKERANNTQLTLTHEKLPDQAAYDGHEFGWLSCLDSLATRLNTV